MIRSALVLVGLVWCMPSSAQQFFSADDGTVDFAKAPGADPADPANQDAITDSVAITRGATLGLFNAVSETAHTRSLTSPSPAGTLWFFGATVQDVISGTVTQNQFEFWTAATNQNPPSTVGQDAVLFLEANDAYVDIRFTNWGVGGGGDGSFAYTRAIVEPPVLGLVGDYNFDFVVDAADYTVWRDTLGSTTDLSADGDNSGEIDAGDYDAWVENFGEVFEAPFAIPEPAGWLLGVIALGFRRRQAAA